MNQNCIERTKKKEINDQSINKSYKNNDDNLPNIVKTPIKTVQPTNRESNMVSSDVRKIECFSIFHYVFFLDSK